MSNYSTIHNHRSMIFDDLRNTYYTEAIKNAVSEGYVVLDLGAGLGIHGFTAARYGAQKVYMVEPASIIEITKKLTHSNHLSGQIECIPGTIEEIELPERVDMITSVFTGNFLLTEDLLPSLFYARDKYLRPGGKLIPDRAKMEVVPVSAPEYYAEYVDIWNKPSQDLYFDPVRRFAANSLYTDSPEHRKADFVSAPVELLDLDLMEATDASCQSRIEVEVLQDGICHGWLGWFDMRLGDYWLSTSPKCASTHWSQVFLPLSDPLNIKKGDTLSFELIRPEFGDWSWSTGYHGKYQRNSTFFSQLVSTVDIQKKSDFFKPQLSPKGKAAKDVLMWLDGEQSTAVIVEKLMANHPQSFPDHRQASKFVKKIIWQFV